MTDQPDSVSGHYAGAFTRLGATVIDWFVIVTVYGFGVASLQWILNTFFRLDLTLTTSSPTTHLIGLGLWAFLYLVTGLSITGRSVGKAILGLKVVTRGGAPVDVGRATVRVLAFPLNFVLFGVGFLGVLLGRERRALHDVIARTAVVYDWGDRPAQLPAPINRWLQRKSVAARPDLAETIDAEVGTG